jgi:hypothetical protein
MFSRAGFALFTEYSIAAAGSGTGDFVNFIHQRSDGGL